VKARVTVWPTNAPPDWLAVDLTSEDCPVTYYASEAALPWGRISGNQKYKGDVLLMRKIPVSHVLSFIGSPETEANRTTDGRETRRMCTLTNDFFIGIYPLTFRQFYLLKDGPTSAEERLAPVFNQSYNRLRYNRDDYHNTARPVNFPTTSRTFVGSSSLLQDWRTRTGLVLDLPTAAQWEIACRAGTDGPTYAALNLICNPEVHPNFGYEVGLYQPNDWQLYDMIGNRYEWCLDYFSDNISAEAVTDPLGAASDGGQFKRVIRGTYHTGTYSTHMRAAFVTGEKDFGAANYQHVGFRLCITLP
jgi:formylglycine-generating enzyme required for sulfatase activity